MQDYSLKVSDFKLQSCHWIHFQTNTLEKGMNPLIPPSYGFNSIYAVLQQDYIGIEYLTKIDMPFNKRDLKQK